MNESSTIFSWLQVYTFGTLHDMRILAISRYYPTLFFSIFNFYIYIQLENHFTRLEGWGVSFLDCFSHKFNAFSFHLKDISQLYIKSKLLALICKYQRYGIISICTLPISFNTFGTWSGKSTARNNLFVSCRSFSCASNGNDVLLYLALSGLMKNNEFSALIKVENQI